MASGESTNARVVMLTRLAKVDSDAPEALDLQHLCVIKGPKDDVCKVWYWPCYWLSMSLLLSVARMLKSHLSIHGNWEDS